MAKDTGKQPFQTLSVLDEAKTYGEGGVPIPTLEGVAEAKKWVDENEL
ncbi:hypothetical protein AGMMS49975_09420 [Clostridia bacterium]|nr:hypothetical protein AGMMS49975_09420 [Clostridia bacterium]